MNKRDKLARKRLSVKVKSFPCPSDHLSAAEPPRLAKTVLMSPQIVLSGSSMSPSRVSPVPK